MQKLLITIAIVGNFLLANNSLATFYEESPREWTQVQKDVQDAWRVRKETMSLGTDPTGTKQLERIRQIQSTYNITSIPSVSFNLLREMLETKEVDHTKLQYAKLFSPVLSSINYFYCVSKQDAPNWTSALSQCFDGLWIELQQTEHQLRYLTNGFYVFLYSLLIVAVIFCLLLCMTYVKPVSQYWSRRFSNISSHALICLLGSLLLLSWMYLGELGALGLLMIVFWRYLHLGEKIVLSMILLLIALIPFGLYAPALHVHYQNSVTSILEDPMKDVFFEKKIQQLQNWLRNHPKDAETLFVLAQIEKNLGRLDEAEKIYYQALQINPKWSKPFVNLGNLAYIKNQKDIAIELLQKAISANAKSLLAYFNASKIFYENTLLKQGAEFLKKAKEIDPQAFSQLDRVSKSKDSNYMPIDEKLEPHDIKNKVWSITPEVTTIRNGFFQKLFSMFSILGFWIFLGIIFSTCIVLDLLWPAKRNLVLISKRRQLDTNETLDVFDPNTNQFANLQNSFVIKLFEKIQEGWSSVVLPGSHYYFRGEYMKAFLAITFAVLLMVPIVIKQRLIQDIFMVNGFPRFPMELFFLVLFGLLYLKFNWNALRK